MNLEASLDWLKSAEFDIRNNQYIIEDKALTGVVAFHAQQVIEKSLKAFLEYKKKTVPKEHSLLKLYSICKNDLSFDIEEDLLIILSKLYLDTRYPGNFGLLPNGLPDINDSKYYSQSAIDIFNKI